MNSIPWICKNCGAEIGKIYRKKIAERDANLQVLVTPGAELAGLGRVRCPGCGGWQTWEPGRVGLDNLIAAHGKMWEEKV